MTTETIYSLIGLALLITIGVLVSHLRKQRRQLKDINHACAVINDMKNEEYLRHQEERQDWERQNQEQHALILAWQSKAAKQTRKVKSLTDHIAELDSELVFDDLLEGIMAICQRRGIPYTINELMACATAYHSLRTSLGSAVLATTVFDVLVTEVESQDLPWGWLAAELEFEERALKIGRREALDEDIALSFNPTSIKEQDLYRRRGIRLNKPIPPTSFLSDNG